MQFVFVLLVWAVLAWATWSWNPLALRWDIDSLERRVTAIEGG